MHTPPPYDKERARNLFLETRATERDMTSKEAFHLFQIGKLDKVSARRMAHLGVTKSFFQKKSVYIYNPRYIEHQRNWRKRNPDKIRAHRDVFVALRNGSLSRMDCFCGNPKSEAHHLDYSKPLNVVWLCRKHHQIADQQRRLTTSLPSSGSYSP